MTIDRRILQVAAEVLEVPIATLTRDSSPRTIPTWDAFAFSDILVKVNQALHIDIDAEQADQMHNLGDVIDIAEALVFGA